MIEMARINNSFNQERYEKWEKWLDYSLLKSAIHEATQSEQCRIIKLIEEKSRQGTINYHDAQLAKDNKKFEFWQGYVSAFQDLLTQIDELK